MEHKKNFPKSNQEIKKGDENIFIPILPKDMYLEIFSFLKYDKEMIKTLNLCCKAFRFYLLSSAKMISIFLNDEIVQDNNSFFDLNFLKPFENIEYLEISNYSTTRFFSFINVPSFPNLLQLNLDKINHFNFSNFDRLKILKFYDIHSFEKFSPCDRIEILEEMVINDENFPTNMMECFPKLKTIRKFQINWKPKIPPTDFSTNKFFEFCFNKNIREINVSNLNIINRDYKLCKKLEKITIFSNNQHLDIPTSFTLPFVAHLKELRFETTARAICLNQIFYEIKQCKTLKKIILFNFHHSYSTFCEQFLSNVTQLTHLSLENVTDVDFSDSIKQLVFLEFFHTGDCNKYSIDCFQNCKNLKRLVIGECNFTNDFFNAQNSDFSILESLQFTNKIKFQKQNFDFNILKNMKNLKNLDLRNSFQFEHFSEILFYCKTLEKLFWGRNCPAITRHDVQELEYYDLKLTHLYVQNEESKFDTLFLNKLSPSIVELVLDLNNLDNTISLSDLKKCKKLKYFNFSIEKMDQSLFFFHLLDTIDDHTFYQKNNVDFLSEKEFFF